MRLWFADHAFVGFGILMVVTATQTSDTDTSPQAVTFSGRLIAVKDGGRCARVYNPFYVYELRFAPELWDLAAASAGAYVRVAGMQTGTTIEVSEMSASHDPGKYLAPDPGADIDFKVGPDGRIEWDIWPEDEDPNAFDEALKSWRQA